MFTIPTPLVSNLRSISIVAPPRAIQINGIDLAGVGIQPGLTVLHDSGGDAGGQAPGQKNRKTEARKPHGHGAAAEVEERAETSDMKRTDGCDHIIAGSMTSLEHPGSMTSLECPGSFTG